MNLLVRLAHVNKDVYKYHGMFLKVLCVVCTLPGVLIIKNISPVDLGLEVETVWIENLAGEKINA